MSAIRFGIQTGQQFAAWDEIVRIWQRAEALGYDTAWTYDHFVAVMMDPFDPTLEAWSCLAALAVHTSRIRIGAGWYEPEHSMFGLPFGTVRERCERLDEALHVIRGLWHDQYAAFAGAHYRVQAAIAEPKPVQQPHPPITIAGAGEKRLLPIVARHADAWSSFGSPDVFRRKIEILRGLCETEQRDCEAIEKGVLVPTAITDDLSTVAPLIQGYAMYQGLVEDEARKWMLLGTVDDLCRQIDAFVAAGVRHFVVTLSPYNFDVFERFAAEVMPRYR